MPWPQSYSSPSRGATGAELAHKNLSFLKKAHPYVRFDAARHHLVGYDKASTIRSLPALAAIYGFA